MTEREQERAAVVAWLREESKSRMRLACESPLNSTVCINNERRAIVLDNAADAIERRAHLKGQTDGNA